MRTQAGPPPDGPARGRSDAQVTGADPAMGEAIRAAVAVSGLDPRVVTSDPAYLPVLAALARQLRLRARTQPGELPPPLPERAADLERAIAQGNRARGPGNLALLAAHERLERLGRPLNAVVTAVGAPRR
ncbi:MAG TPA: hypothetical protein VE343_12485, partial [Streptosporangiaceae bacterium]|nr:hypothetical protein [Streptosporangiaceae bacterium]